jgi:hypothetical protein
MSTKELEALNPKELEALFYALLNHNLTCEDFHDIVDYINNKIQNDKTK